MARVAPRIVLPRFDAGLTGLRVLIVDDSELNLHLAQRILELEGAVVSVANNGEQALRNLSEQPDAYDVVLMDVQMPVLDGREVARRIRGELELSALPIIALTADAQEQERQRALAAGMDDCITKPVSAAALDDVLLRWTALGAARPG